MEPEDQAGDRRRDELDKARRTRARIFLAVAALFLYSAATQGFAPGAGASDRLWSAVLALIAVGSGLYFWRVMGEERSGGDGDAPEA
ncbi:MAG: hypothetical protein M3Q22_07640 [Actinomycetota bacterium]|nr:hypothetical protein [Actinomycetota bacterium]